MFFFKNWLSRSSKSQVSRQPRRSWRMHLESLEDRCVPATFTVNTLVDENDGIAVGNVSLRDAISAASSGDVIDFSVTGTISLANDQLPTITNDLTITGPGAAKLTIDGNHASRILQVDSGVTVALSGLTIANGASFYGGGILNTGTLSVTNSTLTGNSGGSHGGGIANAFGTLSVINSTFSGNSAALGGGILNLAGTLSVLNSTLSGNSATYGGGIVNDSGTATVTNSTLSGNSATAAGGGIVNAGPLTVTNSTLSGNSAPTAGGIYNLLPDTMTLNNSIVANSTSGGDIQGSYTGSHNLTGTVTLGALQNNGGPTMTHALPPGSPAIDAGDNTLAVNANGNPLTTDQRGLTPRIVNGTVDIGAFEAIHNLVVTTLSDEDNGSPDVAAGTGTSLREAMAFANLNPGVDTITFSPTLTLPGTITLALGQLPTLTDDATITGPGAASLTIDAHAASRILQVNSGVTVGLSGLTLANGKTATSGTILDRSGGGILNQGTLSVTDSTLSGNFANVRGGGIYNSATGTLTLTNDTLSGNSAPGGGGGIFNGGTAAVTNSTLSGNFGPGGGIFNGGTMSVTNSTLSGNTAARGGGIYNSATGTLTLTNDTLSGNSATAVGGGIVNGGTMSVSNSTLSGNSAALAGGGIVNGGTLTVTNSTFSGNTATRGSGGGIGNSGAMTVTNSTLSGNSAVVGGGLYGSGIVANCTVSGNSASSAGGGISAAGLLTVTNSTVSGNSAGYGGGIFFFSSLASLNNSIIADNTLSDLTTPNDLGVSENFNQITAGNSLIGDAASASAVGLTDGVNGNIVGHAALLGPLTDNGGPTKTIALLPGSPALNAGSNALAAVSEVQRVTTGATGTFTLTFNGETTASLTAGVTLSATTVRDALNALSTIGGVGGSVFVVRSGSTTIGFTYYITFIGSLAGQDLPQITASGSGATTTSTITEGGPLVTDQRGPSFPRFSGTVDIGAFEVQNQAPTANAGGPYSVAEGDSVFLSGALSSDPDQPANTLTYEWDLDGDGIFGETGTAATRGNETGVSPTFSAAGLDGLNPADSVTVSLRVTDNGGLTDTKSVNITVTNVAPTATFSNGGSVLPGQAAQVSFSNQQDPSSADVNAGFRYSYSLIAGGLATTYASAGTATTANFTFTSPGSYTVYGRIFDKDGGFTTSTTVITVLSASQATANLQSAVNGSTIDSGVKNSLVSKLDGAIQKFDQGNTTAGINKLQSFINEVKAQRGKKIDTTLADAWIAAVQAIIDAFTV